MSEELSIDNQEVKATLAAAEATHVRFLRAWANEAPRHVVVVAGVNILQALSYELIQLINNAFLGAYINEQTAREIVEAGAE